MEVGSLSADELQDAPRGESTSAVRTRVVQAHARQLQRQGKANAHLDAGEIETCCPIDDKARSLLRSAIERMGMSARAYHRVLKVARSVADLAGAEVIGAAHVAEAVQYRRGLPGEVKR